MAERTRKSLFVGKWVIVTGAGRGLGRSCALTFARYGADVVLISRTAEQLRSVADEISVIGKEAIVLSADISDFDQLDSQLSKLPASVKPAVLINNASVIEPFGKVWETDPAAWEKLIRINVVGSYFLSHWALQYMIPANSGSIVNISSGVADKDLQGTSAYNASKAALERFCGTLAAEVADTNISVTILRPGRVNTEMQTEIRATPPSKFPAVSNWIEAHQQGQLLSPDVPALAALWLSGPGGREYHGKMIDVREEGFMERVRRELGES